MHFDPKRSSGHQDNSEFERQTLVLRWFSHKYKNHRHQGSHQLKEYLHQISIHQVHFHESHIIIMSCKHYMLVICSYDIKSLNQRQHIDKDTSLGAECTPMLHLMVWFLKRQRLTKQSPRDVTIVIGLYVPPGQGCGRSSDSGQLRK